MAPTFFKRRGLRPPRTPPATLGAPRRSRGAPRYTDLLHRGPDMAPKLRIRRAFGGRLARPETRLRRAQPRDRNHERRTGHVRHPYLVTELHRRRLAAVLAADTDLEIRARAPPAFDADSDQLAHALLRSEEHTSELQSL